jgi:peptide/nickel transport system ATP-binding protein
MRHGRQVETAPVARLFAAPKEMYTAELLHAVPVLGSMQGQPGPRGAKNDPGSTNIVELNDLTVRFDIKAGLLQRTVRRVHAVESVSLDLKRGETLAIVGESGCGKSTTAKAIMNLVPWQGSIRVAGRQTARLLRQTMKPILRDVQMIFQDPFASLDPRMRVGEIVAEPLVIHKLAKGSELSDRTAHILERVGLSSDAMRRYPHEFSGGQRQRICIARALTLSPKAIIADESVSALDVSIQAQVLELLQDVQNEMGTAYLFISHDMAVVEQISHRVAVMFMGQIVEMGTRAQLFENPRHDYTRKLLAAVPIPHPVRPKRAYSLNGGEIVSPVRDVDYVPPAISYREIEKGHLVAEGDLAA